MVGGCWGGSVGTVMAYNWGLRECVIDACREADHSLVGRLVCESEGGIPLCCLKTGQLPLIATWGPSQLQHFRTV